MDKYQETFETWNNIAGLYQAKFMDLDLYNQSSESICVLIEKPNAKLLDIGCGPGNISAYLLSKRPDFQVLGIDIAPNMIELARQNIPNGRFELMDTREIGIIKERFDGIIGGFCLPYLSEQEAAQLIANAATLLNEKGLLYLSFVEGDPKLSDYKTGSGGRVFFYYHVLDNLKKVCVEYGLDEFKTFEVQFPKGDNGFELHTILTARKM